MTHESDQPGPTRPSAAQFATTHWSLVFAAGHGASAEARGAMAELCRIYWYPLYAYARQKGAAPEAAQDLTQGFFEHLLEHDLVASAEAARGRFRAFLLRCFKNFTASEHARATRQKRGGGQPLLSLDAPGAEERFARDLSDPCDPEVLYEKRWALAVIEEALRQLRAAFAAEGKERAFALLAPRLSGARDGAPSAELARELQTTEATVNVMVHRLRRRYREVLQGVVLRTVDSPIEVEEEMRYLLAVLQR